MTSRIWTIEDVRYLRESPSMPIKRNDASLAVFSYTRMFRLSYFLLWDIAGLFYGAPGGFVRIFFRGTDGNKPNKHEYGTTTVKGIGPAATPLPALADRFIGRFA